MKNTTATRRTSAEKIVQFPFVDPPADAQKQLLIDNDPLVFAGPMTDNLIGPDWRFDTVHFHEAGLRLSTTSNRVSSGN